MKQEPNSPYIDDIQDINQAGRHLLAIVNDILDFSRAEAGTMGVTLGEIEVSALIENIRETSQTYLAHTDNSMEILIPDDVGPIYSDTDKIRCILLNIINNACKYTHNGKITLQVSKDRIDNEDYVIFTITDTGIGMDHEDMSRMFDAFVQGDDSFSRKYEGIGLGLALSLKYIHLLGGVMCVESEPGDGSRFAVYLPEITSVDSNTTAQESTTPEFI
jgi:signal transduction histidine kinase